jgi:hypothetical protein
MASFPSTPMAQAFELDQIGEGRPLQDGAVHLEPANLLDEPDRRSSGASGA